MDVEVQGKHSLVCSQGGCEIIKGGWDVRQLAFILGLCHSFVYARYLAFITFFYCSRLVCSVRLSSSIDCSAKLYYGHGIC